MSHLHEILGYPLFFIAGLELLLGYLLLKQNPNNSPVNHSAAAVAFFSSAFALISGIIYVRSYIGLPITFFARLNWISWFTLPAALQLLYYITDEKSRTSRVIGIVLYPFWTLVLCIALFTDLIVNSSYQPLPFRNYPGPLENSLRFIGFLLVIWTIIRAVFVRREASGIVRKELNYFLYGIIIFAGGAGLTAGLLQLFGGFGLDPALGSYFGLPWVVLSFYSIARYNLFDMRILLSRVYGVVVLLIIFTPIQAGLLFLFVPTFGVFFSAVLSLPAIGFLFFGTSLPERVQQIINFIVIREQLDYQENLRRSADALSTILDLDSLLLHIVRSVRQNLGVRDVCLYLPGPSGGFLTRRDLSGNDAMQSCPDMPPALVRLLESTQQPVVREIIAGSGPAPDAAAILEALRRLGAEALVPVVFHGELKGILSLGPRDRGRSYTQNDLQLLLGLARSAAAAIVNASLFDETVRIRRTLQESERKFRTLAETVSAAIFIYQEDRLLYANPAGATLTGYTLEVLAGMPFASIVHPDFRDRVTAGSPIDGTQRELKIQTREGDMRWVLMSTGVMEHEGSLSVIRTCIDITVNKDLEGKVAYMRRMEALGRLAGGVAHDFNNVLTSIVGHSGILQLKMRKDDPLHRHVDQIIASTKRAATLTERLLTYGSRKEHALAPCDLAGLVESQQRFLAGIVRDEIIVALDTAASPLPVLADRHQLERVIMNLVANARDAIRGPGTITVGVGRSVIDSEFIRIRGFGRPGAFCTLWVADTGAGMDEATQKKIFEPFFTTKSAGKGTGFGLSIVYDIIKDHQGYIDVRSSPGAGSTFTCYLPSVAVERAAPLPPRPPDVSRGGDETVLLVEDDGESRKLIRTVLEGAGYTVVEADQGAAALSIVASAGSAIQLILTDVIMPVMNGRELAETIITRNIKVPMLFLSGYPEEQLRRSGMLVPGVPLLDKTAPHTDLLKRVRQVLDAGAA